MTALGVRKLDYTLVFEVSQITQDLNLLQAILDFIGLGFLDSYFPRKARDLKCVSRIRVSALPFLQHFVLPFFLTNPLLGFKRRQYDIWLEAVLVLMSNTNYSKAREEQLNSILTRLSYLLNKDKKS